MKKDCDILDISAMKNKNERRHTIIWFNVIALIIMHVIALYGVFLMVTKAHVFTALQLLILHFFGMLGTTAGLHRLWSHRSYKAKWPLRLILMVCTTIGFQGTIYQWCRDHRAHHKGSDTYADPHNINNGFFFSHVGWLLCKKFPEVAETGAKLDLEDLLRDPIVRFQKRNVRSLVILMAVILPTITPMILWKESFSCAFCVNMLRYMITLHITLCVNSFAHLVGQRPYDKNIQPTENYLLSILTIGEGFHNFHHTFPWDYKASEFGNTKVNFTSLFIELFAKIGWAYDLKTTSEELIKKRCSKTGDGTHEVWGWGDKDQPLEDFEEATIICNKNG